MHACRFSTNCNHVAVFYQHVYQHTLPSPGLTGGGQAGAEEGGGSSGKDVALGLRAERPDVTYAETLQASDLQPARTPARRLPGGQLKLACACCCRLWTSCCCVKPTVWGSATPWPKCCTPARWVAHGRVCAAPSTRDLPADALSNSWHSSACRVTWCRSSSSTACWSAQPL